MEQQNTEPQAQNNSKIMLIIIGVLVILLITITIFSFWQRTNIKLGVEKGYDYMNKEEFPVYTGEVGIHVELLMKRKERDEVLAIAEKKWDEYLESYDWIWIDIREDKYQEELISYMKMSDEDFENMSDKEIIKMGEILTKSSIATVSVTNEDGNMISTISLKDEEGQILEEIEY